MYNNEDEDPFQTYLGRAQVGLTDFGGAMDAEDSLDGGEFCTPSNLLSSLQYINNTLDAFGFPPSLILSLPPSSSLSDKDEVKMNVEECVKLVNTLYSILQKHQKDVDFRSDSADRIRRLQADKEQAVSASRRWEEKANAIEREISFMAAKERKLEEQMRRMKDRWDGEKEESTRQIASLQHRDSQAQHEIRKKEREYVRLQERLQYMLNERNREVKAGMDILQTIQREGKKRAGWKMQGGKNVEDEMYKMIITMYENKQQELVEEANGLRNSLRDLQAELQQLLNEHQPVNKRVHASDAATTPTKPSQHLSPSSPSTPLTSSGVPNEEILSGQFDMPYNLVRDTVEERIRAQMHRFREVMRNRDAQATNEDQPSDPTSLSMQKQIEECKKIIEDQNELVQYLLKFSKAPTPLPLSPSSLPSSSSSSPSSSSLAPSSSSEPTSQPPASSSPKHVPETAQETQDQTAHAQTKDPAHAHAQSPARNLFPLYPQTPGVYRGMEDSREELEQRVLGEERRLFEEQRKNFEEERKRVAEMALEIAKERLELQELKQQLLLGPQKPGRTYNNDTSLSESFISELEQVTLQSSMDNYFKNVPPSPITYKHK